MTVSTLTRRGAHPTATRSHAAAEPLLDLIQASEIRDDSGARRFGSPHTLRRRIKDGSLPATKIGTRYVMRMSDLEALERTRIAATEEEAVISELDIMVNRILVKAPELTDEQISRVGRILRRADLSKTAPSGTSGAAGEQTETNAAPAKASREPRIKRRVNFAAAS